MEITQYLTFDLPVPYRNILIYPATVRDYFTFNFYSQCLTVEKNLIPDSKIISMTELQYLYYASETDEKTPYVLFLDRLFSICLKDDESFENIMESVKRYGYRQDKTPFFTIGEEKYTSEDFEEIKQIIVKQNLIELPDENISKKVRDSLEKAREYKNKILGNTPATLEDYIISLAAVTGWNVNDIYSMSIRKFLLSIKRLDIYVHYKIFLAASLSGMVEFKDKSIIKHWLNGLEEEGKYSDVSVDLESIQNKVSFEDAKKNEEKKYK